MLKTICASVILFCYVVIGVLNSVESVYTKPVSHNYVHSLTCQLKNYLRLDCFDACNGEQQMHQYASHPDQKLFIVSSLSLDLHFMPCCNFSIYTAPQLPNLITHFSGCLSQGISKNLFSPPDSFPFES
jgi:hypothetical protein